MTTLYSAGWVLPISSPPIKNGAVAIDGSVITAVGDQAALTREFPEASRRSFEEAVILPGLINTHSHLELTAMRGFLDHDEGDFFSWLKKLTTARLERMTPDVLLADLGMPQMNGFDLIDRVRRSERPAIKDIPAAALTAYARSEDRTKALRSGFQIHLAKPVDPAELMAAMAALARRA